MVWRAKIVGNVGRCAAELASWYGHDVRLALMEDAESKQETLTTVFFSTWSVFVAAFLLWQWCLGEGPGPRKHGKKVVWITAGAIPSPPAVNSLREHILRIAAKCQQQSQQQRQAIDLSLPRTPEALRSESPVGGTVRPKPPMDNMDDQPSVKNAGAILGCF